MSKRLSMERVFLTHDQVKRVSKAIREKNEVSLMIKPTNTIGNHPIFLNQQERAKLHKARLVGTGCKCHVDAGALGKMAKSGKGLYDVDEGKGMFTFGNTVKKRASRARKAPLAVTGNTSVAKPTFEEPVEQPAEKKIGVGLYQFGSGIGQKMKTGTYGASTLMEFPTTFK